MQRTSALSESALCPLLACVAALTLSACLLEEWRAPADGGTADGLGFVDGDPPDAGDAGDAGDPDGGYAPGCHYDCFGSATCFGGQVVVTINAPVPCEHWKGACPTREPYACEKGCAEEGHFSGLYENDPTVLCVEGAPKKAGSPCESAADCLPTPAVIDWDAGGTVHNVYLQCDTDAGVCVEAAPAEIDGWLSDCGLSAPDSGVTAGSGAYGFVATAACPGGACAFYAKSGETCIRQGCTGPCEGDHQCPPGAMCSGTVKLGDGGLQRVCKAGRPNVIGDGLTCR